MNWKKFFSAMIIIGFVTSLFIGYQRHAVEAYARAYELTMLYEEAVKMASFADQPLDEALNGWREAGINSISLNEMTIHNLEINGRFHLHSHFEGNDLVLEGDRARLEMIAERFANRLEQHRQITFRDDGALVIEGKVSDFFKAASLSKYDLFSKRIHIGERSASILQFVGLGYLTEDIEQIKRAGLALRFRPAYVYGVQNAKYAIDQTLDYIDKYSQQPYICFSGNDVLGTDLASPYLAEQLMARNIAVAMIEAPIQRQFVEQAGLQALVEQIDYRAIRGFSTFDFIRDRYDYQIPFHHHGEEISNAYFRAITERNINLIFFKTYTKYGKLIDVPISQYKANFDALKTRLKGHGIVNISNGWVTERQNFYMDSYHVDNRLVGIVALAVMAALFLLINLFYQLPNGVNALFSASAALGVMAVYLLGIKVAQFNLLFGFLTTVVFAILAVYYIIWQARRLYDRHEKLPPIKVFMRGVAVLFIAVIISLIGAAFEISFYADSKFLLEMEIFRGVKLSQLVPLMAAFVMALYYFGKEILQRQDLTRSQQLKYVLALNVKIWQVLLGALFLILIAVLLLRSGHDSNIGTASVELTFRNFLEYFLYARPRSKALILGFPIVIIFMHVVNGKKYAWSYPALAFLAAIGQIDILNTFSHIRTPLVLSIVRVFLAFIMSLLFYGIYIVGFLICLYIFRWFKRKLAAAS